MIPYEQLCEALARFNEGRPNPAPIQPTDASPQQTAAPAQPSATPPVDDGFDLGGGIMITGAGTEHMELGDSSAEPLDAGATTADHLVDATDMEMAEDYSDETAVEAGTPEAIADAVGDIPAEEPEEDEATVVGFHGDFGALSDEDAEMHDEVTRISSPIDEDT